MEHVENDAYAKNQERKDSHYRKPALGKPMETKENDVGKEQCRQKPNRESSDLVDDICDSNQYKVVRNRVVQKPFDEYLKKNA